MPVIAFPKLYAQRYPIILTNLLRSDEQRGISAVGTGFRREEAFGFDEAEFFMFASPANRPLDNGNASR